MATSLRWPKGRTLLLLAVVLALVSLEAFATAARNKNRSTDTKHHVGEILSVLENEIEQCAPVRKLTDLKESLEAEHSPVMRTVFAWLFPFGPAWNSILGTFYISSVPNFILAFIPAKINTNTLNTMTAFATGGLLSDVFLHLVPHAFMGESAGCGVRFVMVEEKRNILVGLGIFLGFAAFFFMEKTLRVLGGGEEDGAGHSHSHSPATHTEPNVTKASGASSTTSQNDLRKRNADAPDTDSPSAPEAGHEGSLSTNGPSKLSAYLNLFGDFVHNMWVPGGLQPLLAMTHRSICPLPSSTMF
ncbi:hypothetical protein D9619_004118 [Psilocybe cf. subviscida]|uniref:Uncharacterized protein n=1 Tax=Psilocybe cf. subviscida TaxID=2480587 RepID=A0A8H5BQX7_9AGAR|nr:hypothetical protein D9619_004118 [Psilocybe cf. subviscida]